MLRKLKWLLVVSVASVSFVASSPAWADEPSVPPAAQFEMKFDIPKTWTVAQAKRGSTPVVVYTIAGVKDAVFVVYPPSAAYGATIKVAIDTFMTKELGKLVVTRYPKKPRPRTTWYGIKHIKQQAMTRAGKRYGMRVVYAFNVKGSIQIAVAEAKSSRVVKKLLTALSSVTAAGSAQARKPVASSKPPPAKAPPAPATQPTATP